MKSLTVRELMKQVIDLYHAGSYDLAYGLLTREASRFPDRATRLYYWRICLASRAGRLSLALEILNEALNAGVWYPATQLQEEEDLLPLHDLPEFKTMLEICDKRQLEAQSLSRPSLELVEPDCSTPTDATKHPLLIALHGDYNNARDTLPYWMPVTNKEFYLAVPQSTQVGTAEGFIWDDFELSEKEVVNHYKSLREQYPVDPKRTLVGGFSLGGTLAIWLAFTRAIPARGFIAVGPYLPKKFSWLPLIEICKKRNIRGYIIIGKQDTACYQGAIALANLLKANNIPCELEIHPQLGHDFPPDFNHSLSNAVSFLLENSKNNIKSVNE
jgi:predicted esterase